MRLTKSLLCNISALALATGAAFAGDPLAGDPSIPYSSSYPMNGSESLAGLEQSDTEYFAESDVMYIYPVQVTEYYVLVPSVDSETPQG